MHAAPNYLDPQIPPAVKRIKMPVVSATPDSLKGYGLLVDSRDFPIEIVRWPAKGWRPVDPDSGDEGGTTEGTFISQWKGDVLFGFNEAVGGRYILGYGEAPETAKQDHSRPPKRVMLWHANYHPDGGQLFFPLESRPFVVPLAKPGDDVKPEDFVCFRFDGSRGLYIHPEIWHEGVFAVEGTQKFFDKQGAVHARVSVDFPREFGCLLEADLS